MTREEAMSEMSYYGVSEDDIMDIINNCNQKNISPQYIDNELIKLGYDAFFSFEYNDDIGFNENFITLKSKKHTNQ